jgi:hypothetical protein
MLGERHEEEASRAGIRIDIVRRGPGWLRNLYRNTTQGLVIVAIKYIVGYTTIAVKNQPFGNTELFSSIININSIQPVGWMRIETNV